MADGTVLMRVALLHPLDPRGQKLGGIETHVRNVLAHHPADIRVLLVGIDEIGDLPLGILRKVMFAGREIDFLPVLRVAPVAVNRPARHLGQSLTARFALAMLRKIGAIRAAIGNGPACCEIERNEFAPVALLLRKPFTLVVHVEVAHSSPVDSLLARFKRVHLLSQRIAFRYARQIFAVNAAIKGEIVHLQPSAAARTDVLAVAVDTALFRPSVLPDGPVFRVCYAGRLDAIKDPPLMFAALARANRSLSEAPIGPFRALAFDYVGNTDPTSIAGWDAISASSVCHGPRRAPEVATLCAAAIAESSPRLSRECLVICSKCCRAAGRWRPSRFLNTTRFSATA